MIEFEPFPKIARLNRSCIVTEKIDGTNAAIVIAEETSANAVDMATDGTYDRSIGVTLGAKQSYVPGEASNGARYRVAAQSRTRSITPGKDSDNAGFAAWVHENAVELAQLLGPGRHFGEWYGQGIQRGYGLDHKRFALFNTERWLGYFAPALNKMGATITEPTMLGEHGIHTVPELRRMEFSTGMVNALVRELSIRGTQIPGATGPAEGVVVWHNAARQMFKVTVEGDERPKSSQEPA